MPEIVSFKKCEGKLTLWVSEFKLIRLIVTVLVQLYAIYLKDDSVAFDRFCNQPTENFIGLIRMLCNGDDSYPTIIHNLSRYEYVNRSSRDIYIHHQPKRLNVGGCLLTEGEINFEFDHTPLELADLLIDYMQGNDTDIKLMEKFINSIQKVNEEAPYRTRNVPNKISGSKIMSRLISVSNLSKSIQIKEWKKEEIQIINKILLANTGFPEDTCQKLNCTEQQLKNIIEIQKVELSKRNWTKEEDQIIINHISTSIKNKDLEKMLICRTVNDIKKRRTLIKKQFKSFLPNKS